MRATVVAWEAPMAADLLHTLRRWWWGHFGGFYGRLESRCVDCGKRLTADECEHYEVNCERCEGIAWQRYAELPEPTRALGVQGCSALGGRCEWPLRCEDLGRCAYGVKVPQVRLIGTACSSDPCEREQQCRRAGTCDSWRGRFPKDGEWPCEECGKPEKEHVGAGQQCPSGAKRFFPADPDGVTGTLGDKP